MSVGLLLSLCVATPPIELGIAPGLSLSANSRANVQPEGSLALTGELDLAPALNLPLAVRAEIGTSTRGPPWGRGVDAVQVRALDIDLGAALLAKLDVATFAEQRLVLSGGLGAWMRLRRVETAVQNQSNVALGTLGAGALLASLASHYGRWRVGLDLLGLWGGFLELQIRLGLGVQL